MSVRTIRYAIAIVIQIATDRSELDPADRRRGHASDVLPHEQQQQTAGPGERRPVFLAQDLQPVELRAAQRTEEPAQRRHPSRHAATVFGVGRAESFDQIRLFRSHDADIRHHEERQHDQIHRPAVVDDGQAEEEQQVRHIERVPAVREHAAIDQRIRPDLPVLSAARDVDETDDQYPKRLAGQGDERSRDVRPVIERHVAAGDARSRAERDRQQHDREQHVADAKDDLPDASRVLRRRGFAARLT